MGLIEEMGTTIDGKRVVAGIYRVYETHGLPFVVIFDYLKKVNAVPDWCALVREAMSAGVKLDRVMGRLSDGISDVWGPAFRGHVVSTINLAIEAGYFTQQNEGT